MGKDKVTIEATEVFTLVAICSCCGDPSVIQKSFSIEELEARRADIEADNASYTASMRPIFEKAGVKTPAEYIEFQETIIEKMSKSVTTAQLIPLHKTMTEYLLKEAPKYWIAELHIL